MPLLGALGIRKCRAVGKIADLFNAVFYGGSRSFNAGENAILDAVEAELPESEREIFSKQRGAVNLVQRQHPGSS
mgnify:CR=1 FL=1